MRLEDFPEEVREHIEEIAYGPYKRSSDREAYEKLDMTLPSLIGIIRKHLAVPIKVGDRVRPKYSSTGLDCVVIHIDGNKAWIASETHNYNSLHNLETLEKIEVG